MPVQTSSKISPSPLCPGRNIILPGGEIKAHSRSDACSLAWSSSLNMGAPFRAGKLKLFSTPLSLTDSDSCKIEEGVCRGCKGHLRGGMSQPDPPGSQRSFSWFYKTQGVWSTERAGGPSPAGPVPPPHLPASFPLLPTCQLW